MNNSKYTLIPLIKLLILLYTLNNTIIYSIPPTNNTLYNINYSNTLLQTLILLTQYNTPINKFSFHLKTYPNMFKLLIIQNTPIIFIYTPILQQNAHQQITQSLNFLAKLKNNLNHLPFVFTLINQSII